jgi:hypothetical protein
MKLISKNFKEKPVVVEENRTHNLREQPTLRSGTKGSQQHYWAKSTRQTKLMLPCKKRRRVTRRKI